MLYLLLAPHGWEAPGFKPGRLPHDFPSRSSHGGFQGRCLQISAAGEARFQVASTNSLAEALDFESRGRASFRGWASRRLSRPPPSFGSGSPVPRLIALRLSGPVRSDGLRNRLPAFEEESPGEPGWLQSTFRAAACRLFLSRRRRSASPQHARSASALNML